ncbi:MAG: LysR family transcriptional regulator [Flavobacterium sp.]|nr:LysR family transcriptional regulator [Flavobacterium sp.]
MNYTLHQLKLFIKIVETKSITKTAEDLFLTQPAVSIQLRNFQNQFDIPLTEVIGRQLFVTEFGTEIATIAKKILEDVEEIQYKTLEYKNILAGKLKISVVSTGKYVMPYFLTDFLKKYPEVDLTMDVTNKQKVIKSLEKNEVDFALISVMPNNIKIESEVLVENKLFLMGIKKEAFDESKISKNIFLSIPLIYREDGSGTRHIMEKYFEKNDIKTKMKMQLTSNEAVKQAVIAGLGYSIMPLIGCKNELLDSQLQIIPVSGFPIKSDWRLIWLKDKIQSPVAKSYLNFIKQNKIEIINSNFSWISSF